MLSGIPGYRDTGSITYELSLSICFSSCAWFSDFRKILKGSFKRFLQDYSLHDNKKIDGKRYTFFLSFYWIYVYWIIWLLLNNMWILHPYLHNFSSILSPFYYPSANSYLQYAIGFSIICLAVLRLFLRSYPWLYKYMELSASFIRRSSRRDLLWFSAAIRRRFEKKQTAEGGSTFAMYRLGIMAMVPSEPSFNH